MNKINKPLANLNKMKQERKQLIQLDMKTGEITVDAAQIQNISNHSVILHANKLDNAEEIHS